MCTFRTLNANEIDVRVQSVSKDGRRARLILYKDARVDMAILDDKFGYTWKREHFILEGKTYCRVSFWDANLAQWIVREDMGEKGDKGDKGEVTDSFKRACTSVGIGRELYSSPTIWIDLSEKEVDMPVTSNQNPRLKGWVSFRVAEINYNASRNITTLTIVDQDGVIRYSMNKQEHMPAQGSAPKQPAPTKTKTKRISMRTVANDEQCEKMLAMLEEDYRRDPVMFTVSECLSRRGFEVDADALAIAHEKWTNYITEKGL